MSGRSPILVTCNGACWPGDVLASDTTQLCLEYRRSAGAEAVNVKLLLPDFVLQVYHLPDRVLDLLEIAAYIFAADRSITRGSKNAVEYHGWPRSFHFAVRVRDHAFWDRQAVQDRLCEVLRFMSGDDEYRFTFQPGHSTPPADMFDREEFR